MSTVERHISESLERAEDIRWLRAYLQGLLDAGYEPDAIRSALRRSYERFRDDGHEDLADLMLDGLDLVTGWCGPEMGIDHRRTA